MDAGASADARGPRRWRVRGADRAFETWLQTILVPTLRQVAAGRTSIPRTSSIGAFAIREFGGVPAGDERRALLDLIHRVDRVANRR